MTRALARLALAPLERLRGTAGEVAETADLSRRVAVGEGPVEVDALAGDLNAMLERLEDAAEGREAALASARRFAADAGHELRTPLTSLEANLVDRAPSTRRAATPTGWPRSSSSFRRSRAGRPGRPARAEDVDLGELADAVVARRCARATRTSQARLEAPEQGPLVRGEAESLRMLLDNLVENAALHGRPGGTVVVSAAALADGGAELLVDDDGPGIPAADRARVLERFARGADADGPGTGLGLSIAAAQAARHGGALTLEDSPLGGLRVRVTPAGTGTPPAGRGRRPRWSPAPRNVRAITSALPADRPARGPCALAESTCRAPAAGSRWSARCGWGGSSRDVGFESPLSHSVLEQTAWPMNGGIASLNVNPYAAARALIVSRIRSAVAFSRVSSSGLKNVAGVAVLAVEDPRVAEHDDLRGRRARWLLIAE